MLASFKSKILNVFCPAIFLHFWMVCETLFLINFLKPKTLWVYQPCGGILSFWHRDRRLPLSVSGELFLSRAPFCCLPFSWIFRENARPCQALQNKNRKISYKIVAKEWCAFIAGKTWDTVYTFIILINNYVTIFGTM